MASQRFVLRNKNAGGVTDSATPAAYVKFDDAVAAGVAAAAAGGYIVVDSWHMDRIVANTTGVKYDAVTDQGVNDHSAKNYLNQASELFPI